MLRFVWNWNALFCGFLQRQNCSTDDKKRLKLRETLRMRIDRIELYYMTMPLIYPFRTAFGDNPDIHSVLVKMVSGDMYSWGETTPWKAPCYSPEWAGGTFALRLGWDINMLKAVRDSFPNHTLHIDCNAAFTLKDLKLFKKVDRFELAMIEQPLQYGDLIDHAKLQRQIRTPICLDESITGLKAIEQAIELGSCQFVNIKYGRVGGLFNAIKIHDRCMRAGIPCWVGGMLESGVGSGISTELATLPNFRYPADIFPSKVFYKEDLASPEIKLCAPGRIPVSEVPGIPYEPKEYMLNRKTVHKAIIEP